MKNIRLTMRKTVPIITALIFTSRSMGTVGMGIHVHVDENNFTPVRASGIE